MSRADYAGELGWLYGLESRGMRLGLERMEAACALRGHPARAARIVHVGGTNGKGSVVAMHDAVLRPGGTRTGRNTPPQLHRSVVLTRVDGRAISSGEVARRLRSIREDARLPPLSFFEVGTLLAFEAFRDAAPDVVFMPCYYNDAALIAQQCRAQGLNVPLLGGDGWESDKLVPNSKGALEGCYFGNHYAVANESPKVKAFVEAYRKKFGNAPSSLAALGYDDVYVIKKAVEDAGDFDRKKVRDALAKLKGYDGVTGKFDIDENRDARKSISILKIAGEKFDFVRQIDPGEVE
jgi:hypothetical protein